MGTLTRRAPYTYPDDVHIQAPVFTVARASRLSAQVQPRDQRNDEDELPTYAHARLAAQVQQRKRASIMDDEYFLDQLSRQPLRSVQPAKDTEDDLVITRGTRQMAVTRNAPPRQAVHPLVWIGLGMMVIITLWTAILWVYSTWTLNISDHWAHGPDHITVLTGVFGHNNDSAEHPTSILAFIDQGTVEVVEIAKGDPSKSHIYVGPKPSQVVGWQGDPSQAVIDVVRKDINSDGKPDLIITVLGPSFGWNFQRQSLTFALMNTGDGFKQQLAA